MQARISEKMLRSPRLIVYLCAVNPTTNSQDMSFLKRHLIFLTAALTLLVVATYEAY